MREVYHVGIPIMIKFMLTLIVPVEANLISPSTLEVVIEFKTIVTSFPTAVRPVFTGLAVAIGAYLKSDG